MRYLCLDLGRKRVGVAASDPDGILSRPVGVILVKSTNDTIASIVQLLAKEDAAAIVVGLPLQLNGEEGIEAARARAFVAKLAAQVQVPIHMWDERLTSVAAERMLVAAGMRKSKQRRQHIDAAAAAIILQSYLDSHRPPSLLPPDV